MSVWVGLLHGVNVGKRQMKMVELKAALERAGFDEVRTILASGNFCARYDGSEGEVKARAEAALAAAFEFPVLVVVRTRHELEALRASAPFESIDPTADLTRHVVFFDAPLPSEVRVESRPRDTEILRITDREIIIAAYRQPNGRYTENVEAVLKPLYRALGDTRLSTMRNWNTIEKLLT
ncbi:DUF1697 domain-containing protein [Devosia sp. MC532]|uniref:DUF1697 domain-containing protein n=1 Tax=Devosia sp. MC532 TaxID=2799788 RepID=UPI0018F62097|nr:DUF1697 domain-containing protein [Devosia sp. MC532]MBJ7577368.1 DUF1697 domain-containing protein [Devosia sp. MC532]